MDVPKEFFNDCVFVSVDIQDGRPGHYKTLPKFYADIGGTLEDANNAMDFYADVALPNACKVADACRRLGLPMIFIHWGYNFPDAMDLDPEIYAFFSKYHGEDTTKWPHHIDAPDSRPARQFQVRNGEYVIAKAAQDAFPSSNIEYVLRNLGCKNIVFVGGHTGGCLGRTARSAKQKGYKALCVEDATNDGLESRRLKNIEDVGYDYVITTVEFLALVNEVTKESGRRR